MAWPTRSEYVVVSGDRIRVYSNGKRSSSAEIPGGAPVSAAWRLGLALDMALRGHSAVVLQVVPGGLK